MNNNQNIVNGLYKREIDVNFNQKFRETNVYTYDSIERLHLECELKQHEGCVNCIEWNKSGTLLASGSDDLRVMLWDPFKRKLVTSIETKHRGNIFSVKYLPFTNDNIIVTSAADRVIYVHDVKSKSVLHEIHSHRNRVKRLEVANDTPFLFWSSGEDGFIYEHDIRCSGNEVSKILINYSSCNYPANENLEVKCLAINPVRSEYLAVGCNDPYARLYDRRMISIQRCTGNLGATSSRIKCVHEYCPNDLNNLNKVIKYYLPGHVPSCLAEYRKRMKQLTITFLSFNQFGNELLVNLSGEQIYLFDVNNSIPQYKYNAYKTMLKDLEIVKTSEDEFLKPEEKESSKKKKYKLPDKVENLKSKANNYYEKGNYYEAIKYYNKAINLVPNSPILYGNRATAFMKRNWDGDTYAAMRDCYAALSLDKQHMKSHFRLSRCLHELKWHKEAQECLNQFCKLYADYANTDSCETLVDDIEKAIKKLNSSNKPKINNKQNNVSSLDDEKFKDKNGKSNKTEAEEQENNDASEDSSTEDDENNRNEDSNNNNKNNSKPKRTRTKSIRINCKEYEDYLNSNTIDFISRYSGHCNVATDIKEANFIGDKFIGAGSDDGSFYIWDRNTTNIVRVFKADESIVNCIQPHPYTCMIATSGIDSDIKIWTPGTDTEDRVVIDIKTAVEKNQKQMNQNPVEFFFMNIQNSWENDEDDTASQNVGCRTS